MTFMILVMFLGPLRLIRITSGSMEPALKTGSYQVVNRGFSFEKIKAGDIVVFIVAGGGKAAHRVIEIRSDGLITKGDANEMPDLFLVTKENFYGKITSWKNEF